MIKNNNNNTSVKAITTLNQIEAHFYVRLQYSCFFKEVGKSEGPDGKNIKQLHTCVVTNKWSQINYKDSPAAGLFIHNAPA